MVPRRSSVAGRPLKARPRTAITGRFGKPGITRGRLLDGGGGFLGLALVEPPGRQRDLGRDAERLQAFGENIGVLLEARAADRPGKREIGPRISDLAGGDHVQRADAEHVAHPRHLVGERELHITLRVVDELDHLRGFEVVHAQRGRRDELEQLRRRARRPAGRRRRRSAEASATP